MNVITTRYYHSPLGELVLGAYDDQLCLCDWRYRRMRTTLDNRLTKSLRAVFEPGDAGVLDETARQLDEYFDYSRRQFELPLLPVGTEFQQRVWDELLRVPGIGPKSAYRILNLRQREKITKKVQLKNLGVVLKRATPFLEINGWHETTLDRWLQ